MKKELNGLTAPSTIDADTAEHHGLNISTDNVPQLADQLTKATELLVQHSLLNEMKDVKGFCIPEMKDSAYTNGKSVQWNDFANSKELTLTVVPSSDMADSLDNIVRFLKKHHIRYQMPSLNTLVVVDSNALSDVYNQLAEKHDQHHPQAGLGDQLDAIRRDSEKRFPNPAAVIHY